MHAASASLSCVFLHLYPYFAVSFSLYSTVIEAFSSFTTDAKMLPIFLTADGVGDTSVATTTGFP